MSPRKDKGMLFSKIKESSIDLFLLVIITTVLSFYKTSVYSLIRYAIIAYLGVKYIKEIKNNTAVYIFMLIYSLLLGISSFINNNSVTWGVSGVLHGFQLICMFSVLSGVIRRKGIEETLNVLIQIIALLLISTDLLIVLYPYKISSSTAYLIGDKFHVSYMHCLLIALVSIRLRDSKKKYVMLLYLLSMMILIYIKCTTGLIMVAAMFLMELMVDVFPGVKSIICSVNLAAIVLAVENILIWGSSAILYTPWASHIIVDVLGKSKNMTGRFQLYRVIPELIMKKPYIGYGLQTDVFRELFGYGNAQNGLMQIVIESGIVGAIFYFLALYMACIKGNKGKDFYPVYLYVISFIIGSISEMNLSTYFVFGIALLFAARLQLKGACIKKKKGNLQIVIE